MSTPARDHDHWAESLGAWLLGALPEDEAAEFKRHLDECAVCREEAAALQVAVDALPASPEPHAPPPALKARIMAVVEGEAELLHAAGPESDWPRPRRSRFAWLTPRPALAWGIAAVLLLVGIGAGVLASSALRGTDTVTAQVAGGGRASLEIDDGHGRLVASRLPAPPSGRVYQVWLDKGGKTPEPTNVLFTISRDGSASADVPSLDGVKRVMVTDEPSGGSRTPTGKVLLTATT
jgi:anti-sigma-K factor RskA